MARRAERDAIGDVEGIKKETPATRVKRAYRGVADPTTAVTLRISSPRRPPLSRAVLAARRTYRY